MKRHQNAFFISSSFLVNFSPPVEAQRPIGMCLRESKVFFASHNMKLNEKKQRKREKAKEKRREERKQAMMMEGKTRKTRLWNIWDSICAKKIVVLQRDYSFNSSLSAGDKEVEVNLNGFVFSPPAQSAPEGKNLEISKLKFMEFLS